MNSRRMLAIVAGTFLVLGLLGVAFNNGPYDGTPIVSITFLVLGTLSLGWLAYLKR